ncbi:hypothetical protein EMIT043CA1_220095 [Pseudomonas brassicacearum]
MNVSFGVMHQGVAFAGRVHLYCSHEPHRGQALLLQVLRHTCEASLPSHEVGLPICWGKALFLIVWPCTCGSKAYPR